MFDVTIDFTDCPASQDMLSILMREKNLSAEDAILSLISRENVRYAYRVGWGDIAVLNWGHGERYERPFFRLTNPVINIQLSQDRYEILRIFKKLSDYKTDSDAVSVLLVFEMGNLGYHI